MCNNLPIKTISSGLPMKGEKTVIGDNVIKSEKFEDWQIENMKLLWDAHRNK